MIVINQLNYQYKGAKKSALNNFSAEFDESKINVIVGLNGAGKTTLFDLIAGVYPRPAAIEGAPQERDIAYQLQGLPLPSILKGKDYIRLYRNTDCRIAPGEPFPAGLDKQEQAFLEHLKEMKWGHMSFGERRWLHVACMSELHRKLYIFDEPTSGVDPDTRLKIMHRLQRLKESRECTVLMSTHVLHELKFVDCRIFLLHEGKVSFTGSYEQFLEQQHTDNPDEAFRQIVNAV